MKLIKTNMDTKQQWRIMRAWISFYMAKEAMLVMSTRRKGSQETWPATMKLASKGLHQGKLYFVSFNRSNRSKLCSLGISKDMVLISIMEGRRILMRRAIQMERPLIRIGWARDHREAIWSRKISYLIDPKRRIRVQNQFSVILKKISARISFSNSKNKSRIYIRIKQPKISINRLDLLATMLKNWQKIATWKI